MHVHGSRIEGIPLSKRSNVRTLGVSDSRFEAGFLSGLPVNVREKLTPFLYPILRLIVSETKNYDQSC